MLNAAAVSPIQPKPLKLDIPFSKVVCCSLLFYAARREIGLCIYSAETCLCGKTPPRLGHLAPASEVAGGLINIL
jgi:hypothetical protein